MNRCKDVETAIRAIEESGEALLPIIIKKYGVITLSVVQVL